MEELLPIKKSYNCCQSGRKIQELLLPKRQIKDRLPTTQETQELLSINETKPGAACCQSRGQSRELLPVKRYIQYPLKLTEDKEIPLQRI
jgi:hypothetical protein